MATFYVRADGTAAKSLATGPASDPGACMSMATFNASQFDPGDKVIFSPLGGDFTERMVIPSSGTPESPIHYWGEDAGGGEYTMIDVSADPVGRDVIEVPSIANADIGYFSIRGNGGGRCFYATGTTGAGGYTVKVRNIRILSNQGAADATAQHDGCSQFGTSEVEYFDIYAKGCQDAAKTGSHQALTLHQQSKAKVHGLTVDGDCNYGYVGVDDSYAELHDVDISGCAVSAVGLGNNSSEMAKCLVYGGVIAVDTGGALIESGTGINALARIEFHNVTINVTSTKNQFSRCVTAFYDCSINWSDTEFLAALSGGSVAVLGGSLTLATGTGYAFRCDNNSSLYVRDVTISGSGNGFYWANTTGGAGGFKNNWVEWASGGYVLRIISGCSGAPDIDHNTIQGGATFVSNLGSGVAFNMRRNIVKDVATPLSSPTNCTTSGNVRDGTTPDFGSGTTQLAVAPVDGRVQLAELLGAPASLFRVHTGWVPKSAYTGRN